MSMSKFFLQQMRSDEVGIVSSEVSGDIHLIV